MLTYGLVHLAAALFVFGLPISIYFLIEKRSK